VAFRSYIADARKSSASHHIIFVDECHNLPSKVQENLLSVLESPAVLCTVANKDMRVISKNGNATWVAKGDVLREELPDNISFIFATTDPVELKDTILNRLRKIQLEPYSLMEKSSIARDYLLDQGVNLDNLAELGDELSQRCRNIRHLKNDLCETYIDISGIYGSEDLETQLAHLDEMLGIDEEGATDQDLDYLDYVGNHRIVGLDTLAGILQIDSKEVKNRIEPFLLEKGWIAKTNKGRQLTYKGYKKVFGEEPDTTNTDVL